MSLGTITPPETGVQARKQNTTPIASEELLNLLHDDVVRGILDAIGEQPKPARKLASICDTSRPTVYRRLERLEDVGLIESRTELHPDGHHRKVFGRAYERITIVLERGELVTVIEEADEGTAKA